MDFSISRSVTALAVGVALSVFAIQTATAQESWKLATLMQHPAFGATLDDEFAASITKSAGGKLVIERQFVGNEQEMVSQVVRGRLEMGGTSAFGSSVAVPNATVMSVPNIWDSDAQRRFVTDKYAFPVLAKQFDEKGLVLLAVHEAGYNGVFCKMNCSDPTSLKGQKARVSPAAASKMFWSALHTNGVTLPISELWPGLEQNLVVAGDLPFAFYMTTPGAQSAPHFVVTQHLHHPWLYFANKAAWEKIDSATRQKIVAGLPDSNAVRDRWFADEKAKMKDFLSKNGKVYELTGAQKAQWQGLVKPHVDAFVDKLGPGAMELYKAIEKGKEEFKKQKS